MARLDLNAWTLRITAAALQHPQDLAAHIAQVGGVSRSTAGKTLQQLVRLGWVKQTGTTRQPHYEPGLLRQVVQRYALAGLQEDIPWLRDFAPFFALPAPLQRMVQHTFAELLNNATDHSGGSCVTVSLRQTPSHVQLLVSDDGCGLFERLSRSFAVDDPALAMLELSKGKLSTDPARHSGRGLFFASRLADVFDLHANDTAFQHRAWAANEWKPRRAVPHRGTSVYAAFELDTPRTLESVMHAHSLDRASAAFERTVVPLRLLASPQAALDSRAQARRVAARLDRFREAELDFSGIDTIGHSFADELFRVLPSQGPELTLMPMNMSPAVAQVVESIRVRTPGTAIF